MSPTSATGRVAPKRAPTLRPSPTLPPRATLRPPPPPLPLLPPRPEHPPAYHARFQEALHHRAAGLDSTGHHPVGPGSARGNPRRLRARLLVRAIAVRH